MPRKISDEAIETIKKMTMEGAYQSKIGEVLGIHATTVGQYQKKLGLKASNKWHFGESASKEPLQLKEVKPPKPKKKWTNIVEKSVKLQGSQTKFEYSFGTNSKDLSIKTGYSNDVEIDMKDLVVFANELVDIAEMMSDLKSKRD